jgi:hypothetical protein
MMTKLVNLTPHEVRIIGVNGEITIPPSGQVARVSVTQETVGVVVVEGVEVPLKRTKYGEVMGVPEPEEGTYYIVSQLVLAAADRDDLVAPDTANAVRDENGQIVGVPGLITK